MTSLHRFSGPDGFSDPETLPEYPWAQSDGARNRADIQRSAAANGNRLHGGVDRPLAPEILPPVTEGPMTPQEAMQRLHWLMAREREACRAQPNQNALALMLAMMVLQNQIDRAPKPGEHEHRCGVLGCDNRFSCTRERCAGTTWICPACELDQRDTYHSNT